MARPLRIEYAGAMYHVMSRGNARQIILLEDKDREKMLEDLEDSVVRYGWEMFSFCLMPNHFHLFFRTPQPNLSRGMQRLLSTYANGIAKRHRRPGHLFQGRFQGELVEDETYFWTVSRYIHLNPVRRRRPLDLRPQTVKLQSKHDREDSPNNCRKTSAPSNCSYHEIQKTRSDPTLATLQYRRLGETDLRVSSMGLGCVTFGREIDAATSFAVLDRAAERGINLLDTAAVYGEGSSEELIGRWIHDRGTRDRVLLATKVSGRLTRDRIRRSVEGSMKRLRTDRIDLLQAHDWDDQTPLEETLAALDDLVRRGMVRYCGVSNWGPDQLEAAFSLASRNAWSRLESVQPIYNLVDRRIEEGLLEFCAQRGLGVLSYSPLGAGFLTGKYRRGAPVPAGTRFDVKPAHKDIYFTDHGFRVMEGVRTLAGRLDMPMPRLALAWVFRRPTITSVLIGARRPSHIDQAFEACGTTLPREAWERLENL